MKRSEEYSKREVLYFSSRHGAARGASLRAVQTVGVLFEAHAIFSRGATCG